MSTRVDTADLFPGASICGHRGLGVLGSTILLTTGTGTHGPGVLFNDVQVGDEAKEFMARITTPPANGVLEMGEDGTFNYTGTAPSFGYTLFVDGASIGAATVALEFVGAADTAPPVLTGVITLVSKTTTGMSLSCPAATDNVGVVGYEWSRDGGATWEASTQAKAYTGLTPSTAYAIRVRAKDAAGNVSTPALALSVTTSATADTTAPTLTGVVTATALTATSYTLSWPAGADNVAVVGYDVSLDGGSTWADNGATLTRAVSSRTPSSVDQVRVRARDAAGNTSSPVLALAVTLPAAPDVTAPTLTAATAAATGQTTATGAVTTNEAGGTLFYQASSSATLTAAALLAGASQAVSATGVQSVAVSGLSPATAYYLHYLHRDAAGNSSTVLSSVQITTAAVPDTTAPVLTGASATASGQTTATGTVTTNEAGGTLYALFSTSPSHTTAQVLAGSSQAVSVVGTQTVMVGGLQPSTAYYAHYMHQDAAGNNSVVVTSPEFATQAEITPPALVGVITVTGKTNTSIDVSCPEATDNVGVTGYGWSSDGGLTWVVGARTHSFTGLQPASFHQIRARAQDAAGNVSDPTLALLALTKPSGGIGPWLPSSALRVVCVRDDSRGVLAKFTKQPREILDYGFDFTDWLSDCNDTIATTSVYVEGVLIEASEPEIVNGLVIAFVFGGVNGKPNKVTCFIQTAGGRTKEAEISIRIKEI